MDFIRNQIARIQQQLSGLSPSQKMLAGTLVVIMVMTIFWWTRYASDSEMQPVFSQPVAAEHLASMSNALTAAGMQSKVSGGQLLVSSDNVVRAWSVLSMEQLLPRDTSASFEDMLKSGSPFDSPEKTRELYNVYRQGRLAAIISKYPGVASAMVSLDPTRQRGPNGIEPSASVSITLKRRGEATKQLAIAAADLLCGAVSNLQRSHVNVIIDGASYPMRDREDSAGGLAMSDDYLDYVQRSERYYRDKLAGSLGYLGGAFFSVTVKPSTEHTRTTEHKVDPKEVVSQVVSDNSTEDTQDGQPVNTEPGVVSNAPLTAGPTEPAAAATTGGSNSTVAKTEFAVDHSSVDTVRESKPGDLTVTAAAIHVPRSYYLQTYRIKTNSDKDPDPAALDTYIADELRKLKLSTRGCLGLAEEAISVDTFTDLAPAPGAGGSTAAAAMTSSMTLAITDHAKEIALAALALFSLFMVSNIVKKNAPVPVVPPPQPKVIVPVTLDGAEAPIGEASEGVTALEGIELNDEEARGHQMQQQVSDMVSSDPASAAELVKRWLNNR